MLGTYAGVMPQLCPCLKDYANGCRWLLVEVSSELEPMSVCMLI